MKRLRNTGGVLVTATMLWSCNDGSKPTDNMIEIGKTLFAMTVYGGAPGPSPDDPGVTGNGTIFAVPIP